jgi:nucleotide-binding universal stress UspA family protein
MYKNILVPVDGSEKSALAALHAAELASKLGNSELYLLYVVPSLPPYIDISSDRLNKIQQDIMDELYKQGEVILSKVKDDLAMYGLNIHTDITAGHPADEIIKKAREINSELVVMGSRGLGEIKGILMGSVSNRVTKHAGCPALVVR